MTPRFDLTRSLAARTALAALTWAAAWAAMLMLAGRLPLAHLALIVVLASALSGLWLAPAPGVLAAVFSVMGLGVVFVAPQSAGVGDGSAPGLLLVMLLAVSGAVAVLVGHLRVVSTRLRMQAVRADQLHAMGEALRHTEAQADTDEPLARATRLQHALGELVGGPVTLWLTPVNPGTPAPPGVLLGSADADAQAGLALCQTRSQAFGPGTGRHEELSAWYLPLRGRRASHGAALLPVPALMPGADPVRAHAQALCDQMGVALERADVLRTAAQAREEAQAHKLRNTLLAAISHDYRTPLATIMGAASSLHDQAEKLSVAQQRRLATVIVDEAQQLSRMTDNTLQLARLDAPGLRLQCDWESAEELVGTVLRRTRQRDPTRRLRARLEPALPLLRCDALLLVQLLDNLVDNALKYSEASTPVEIVVRRKAAQVVLAVRDRGPGVPPAWRSRIFEVFQRGELPQAALVEATAMATDADASAAIPPDARRGAGVGLAVCLAIARAHGGDLTLRPRGHGGSSFECALPCVEAPHAEAPDAEVPLADAPRAEGLA
jgi:two-component system, OmpR family, sensor histidine kinase KdpD